MAKTTQELQSNHVVTKEDNVIKKVQTKTMHDIEIHDSKLSVVTNLIATKVEDRTLTGFYKQISTNMSVGMKAHYFVCRDLALAEKVLVLQEFNLLKEKLIDMFSRSTWDKYLEIGKSSRVHQLYNEGRLPISWTTQYEIAKMPEDKFKKIKSEITQKTPMRVIENLINDEDSESESKENTKWDKTIFEKSKKLCIVDVEYCSEDYNLMKLMVKDIEKIVKKYNGQHTEDTMSTNGKKFNSVFNTNLLVNTDYITDVELKSKKFDEYLKKEEEKREKTRKEHQAKADARNLEKMMSNQLPVTA